MAMQDRDEAVERVLAIDVIHLLAAEGSHSDAVNEQLSTSEVWQAFSQQRHDLFLPASANPQVSLRTSLCWQSSLLPSSCSMDIDL